MKTNTLTIIQMNDTHGYIEEHWEHFYRGTDSDYQVVGGYARIASYLKKVRQEKKDQVLFLDNVIRFMEAIPLCKLKEKSWCRF